jgi:hypothetical protein
MVFYVAERAEWQGALEDMGPRLREDDGARVGPRLREDDGASRN